MALFLHLNTLDNGMVTMNNWKHNVKKTALLESGKVGKLESWKVKICKVELKSFFCSELYNKGKKPLMAEAYQNIE